MTSIIEEFEQEITKCDSTDEIVEIFNSYKVDSPKMKDRQEEWKILDKYNETRLFELLETYPNLLAKLVKIAMKTGAELN